MSVITQAQKDQGTQYCQHLGQPTWTAYDARGIPLTRVCDLCEKAKLSVYRPEVLHDSNYYTDERIEEDY